MALKLLKIMEQLMIRTFKKLTQFETQSEVALRIHKQKYYR